MEGTSVHSLREKAEEYSKEPTRCTTIFSWSEGLEQPTANQAVCSLLQHYNLNLIKMEKKWQFTISYLKMLKKSLKTFLLVSTY